MNIKISVITVCFNVENSIQKTINSVLEQTYGNFEIIVKDGGSKDGTLIKIPISDKIHVISQNDKGIYNAMNEAIKYASGDYYLFLNAGDILCDKYVFETIVREIKKKPADIYYGDYKRNGLIVCQPEQLSKFTLFRNPLNHQSVFFSKSVVSCGDWYNENYMILADYELMVRLFVEKKCFKHIPVVIDEYEGNGVSESKKGIKKNNEEMEIVRKQYFSKEYLWYKLILSLTLVKLRQWMVKDTTPEIVTMCYRKVTNFINNVMKK